MAAIDNNTFTIRELLEMLDKLSLFSTGKPQISLYKVTRSINEINIYRSLSEINIYLTLQESTTQLQIWRGGLVTEKSILPIQTSLPYPSEDKNENSGFMKQYGELRAYKGSLTSSFRLLAQLIKANPSLHEETLATAAFAGSILTADRLVHLQATSNAMDPWATKQVQRVLNRYTQKTIMEAGAERVAYLARNNENTLAGEEIILNSPISWLQHAYVPMLDKNFLAISVPSADFVHGGDRELFRIKYHL